MKLAVVFVIGCLLVTAESFKLSVLHTNDVHSRLEEAHKYGGVCSEEQSNDGDCVGGVSRLYTKIKEVRDAEDNVLLLDGGDQFQGTFWFLVYHGLAAAQFMKKLEYDAMALGNHEFDIGLPPLQNFINNVTESVEVISANIDNTNEPGLTGYKPYIIHTVAERKIGIVGYTTAETPSLTKVGNTGNLIFNNVLESIRGAITAIKAEDASVNIFIAVGHAGFETDLEIAKEVDEVDLVVGGHTNTFLWTGEDAPQTPAGPYPYKVDKSNGKTALAVQAYTFTKYLGNLSLVFDDEGEVTSWSGNPILLDDSVPKDPEIEAMLAPYRARIEEEGNKPIARAAVTLSGDCRAGECNFGNLVTDAYIHTNILFGSDMRWARAAISMVNGGSVRAPIARGNITNRHLLTSLPFGNDIVTVTVTGETLREVFEFSTGAHDSESNSGRYLQISGARVTYNLDRPFGERVMDLRVRCLECESPNYDPVDPKASYVILTTSFMVGGGDGYTMFVEDALDSENLGLSEADMVTEYMNTLGSVYPANEGRITYVTDEDSKPCPTTASGTTARAGLYTILLLVIGFILFSGHI